MAESRLTDQFRRRQLYPYLLPLNQSLPSDLKTEVKRYHDPGSYGAGLSGFVSQPFGRILCFQSQQLAILVPKGSETQNLATDDEESPPRVLS